VTVAFTLHPFYREENDEVISAVTIDIAECLVVAKLTKLLALQALRHGRNGGFYELAPCGARRVRIRCARSNRQGNEEHA
jgi:hypothetical protein